MLPDGLPKDTELSTRRVCLHLFCWGQRKLICACWIGARLLRLRLAPPVSPADIWCISGTPFRPVRICSRRS
ncbi:hypothetical protein ACLKA6_017616 [Drosophila palustris]